MPFPGLRCEACVMTRFYISLVIVGVLLLAAGGWTVRGVRWAFAAGRRPQLLPTT
jgi:hypothetical protein